MPSSRRAPSRSSSRCDNTLRPNVKRFRGGLVFKAHRLLYHSTLGLRVIKQRRRHPPSTHPCPTLAHACRFGPPFCFLGGWNIARYSWATIAKYTLSERRGGPHQGAMLPLRVCPACSVLTKTAVDRLRVAARAEDAQGKPTQSHISSLLGYED